MLKGSLVILAIVFLTPLEIFAQEWKPEAKFSLEGGTIEQTMLWVSGFSYAVNAIGKGGNGNNGSRSFCSPENGFIGSKVLFEILNARFEGKTITSEQATAEIMDQLPKIFPC